MSTPTPETLQALEARLRQLFADLGIPAGEAVELRADELASVLDTAPPAGVDRPGTEYHLGGCAYPEMGAAEVKTSDAGVVV